VVTWGLREEKCALSAYPVWKKKSFDPFPGTWHTAQGCLGQQGMLSHAKGRPRQPLRCDYLHFRPVLIVLSSENS